MDSTTLRHFYSEFVGIFTLVFVGSAAIMLSTAGHGGLLEVAVAHGLALSIMVTAFMRVAAHFNPAVTIAFMLTRRVTPYLGLVHIVAQILGAVVAAYLLKVAFPAQIFAGAHGGGQAISTDVNGTTAWILEAVATFFLMTSIYGTAVDKRAPQVGGFAIGLVITMDILAIGPFTGASMNPARTLGPAIAYGGFEGLAIYLTAPVVGAIVAALAYEKLVLQGEREGEKLPGN